MRALTLWPEWAWAVAYLGKDVENRGWAPPSYIRGQRIAIHAGKHVGGRSGPAAYRDGAALVIETALRAGLDPYAPDSFVTRLHRELCATTSAVVAVARVEAEVAGSAPSAWAATGQYHWRLCDVTTLRRPVPCRGAQGLWVVPREVEDAIAAQIGRPEEAR
jgi:hypothetical protein